MKKLSILKPMPHIAQFDCCLRELIDLWYDRDYCDRQYITEIKSQNYTDSTLIPEARVWIGEIGNLLLYDSTILDKYHQNYKFALFANEVLHAPNTSEWIFWSRWPRQYEQFRRDWGGLSFKERYNDSVFIGNQTVNTRNYSWKDVISHWHMGNSNQHLENNMVYSYVEYLRALSQSKFGLCLRGVGPKALRETENMGLGVVPLFTPEVSLDYYDPPQECEHFFYVETPEDVTRIVKNTSQTEWEYMSKACIAWYEKNCSIEGSYKTTLEILEKAGVV